jgi:hypothetical protein
MRIENHQGRNIVCGHIYPLSELVVGSEWQGSSGSVVTIDAIIGEWVTYSGEHQQSHEKDSFSFQCRYCLIIKD